MLENSHAILDGLSRNRKANKIITVLEKFVDFTNCKVLDIGTGSGHIISKIGQKCKFAMSVDLNDERVITSNYDFKQVKNERLPFEDKSFDVVISNHIIEHVSNQLLHLSEINRILKKGGYLYLATPNKYWLIDPHYNIPFISWLPRRLSSIVLWLIKKKRWDIYPISYPRLKKLVDQNFLLYNLSLDILKDSKKYNLDIPNYVLFIIRYMPTYILNLFSIIIPTNILILKKK